MSKIVILSTFFLDIPSANGICARSITAELIKMGHEVDVVCFDKDTLSIDPFADHIFTIPQPKRKENEVVFKKCGRFAGVLMGIKSSLFDNRLVELYYKKLTEINSKNEIDVVIAMFFPLESVEALRRFKSGHRDVKTMIFELDSIADGVSSTGYLSIANRSYKKWLEGVYKTVSNTIVMKSHEKHWRLWFEHKNKDKLVVSDLPVLFEKLSKCTTTDDSVKMIYAGLIERRYRSPSYLLSVLSGLSVRMRFEMSFYSKGDCEDEIADAGRKIKNIKQYGYVLPDELEKATTSADVLISLGNSFSNSVPSKLISYLGYGKPIIHFSSQKADVCSDYLSNYPLALIVDQSESVSFAIDSIVEFIRNTKGKHVSCEYLRKTFAMNYPSYSADIINQCIIEEK